MLKSIGEFLSALLDYIAPLRSDFDIVKNLDQNAVDSLPRAKDVEKMDWVIPLFSYKNRKVKAIIWELKYKDNTSPLGFVCKLIFDEIMAFVSDIVLFNSDAKFLLIPIPITDEKRRIRGYNQSEYIAREIISCDLEHILLYAPQWFRKIKETHNQSHSQTKEERMKNLENCFEANPEVEGKYVILIDDVVTTGSTLLEARKTLLSAGAVDVFAFTIAH